MCYATTRHPNSIGCARMQWNGVNRRCKVFHKSLVSPRGLNVSADHLQAECSPVGGLVKLPFVVFCRSLGSQPLWSFLSLLCPPASFTPLRSAERLHCRPHKGRREMSEWGHVKSHKRWFLSLANPLPLQGLNGKISSGVWQNGMALFNFKGVCAIIKKVIYQV